MWDEPVDKPHQSGFPAAAPPAKKHTLSGRNGEVNIIKTAGIGKRCGAASALMDAILAFAKENGF